MKISVMGCGYVGAVTGTCLADLGHEVTFNDVDEEKVEAINFAKPPIFEPGLDKLIERNRGRISATLDLSEAIYNSDLIFLCVGTPSNGDGSINLEYIRFASKDLGMALKRAAHFIW